MLRRHDARHGHAGPFARALPPPLRHRYAGGQRRLRDSWRKFRSELLQDLGSPRRPTPTSSGDYGTRAALRLRGRGSASAVRAAAKRAQRSTYSGPTYNSIDNIAEFFASRGKKFTRPQGRGSGADRRTGFRPGQRVRHPKYGEGTVYQREGDGEDAKITVQFPRFGLKKLVEKYAQLEKA